MTKLDSQTQSGHGSAPVRLALLCALHLQAVACVAGEMRQDLRDLSRPFRVSPRSPIFMVQISNGAFRPIRPALWETMYPESIKPNLIVEICTTNNLDTKLRTATEKRIPIAFRVRSVWPIERYRPMKLELIEATLRKYPIVRALAMSELMNAHFTAEERDYLIAVLDLCRRYDRLFIWTECFGGSFPWMQVGSDAKLSEAIRANKDRVVLINEVVNGTLQVPSFSTLLGLYLAGHIDHWGMNPQFYYWLGSGFRAIDEARGYRRGAREHMPPNVYAQIMMLGAMAGGTGFYFGGERAPHIFDERLQPTETWHCALPYVEALIGGPIIPTRDEVQATVKAVIQADPRELFAVSDVRAKSGKRSLVLRGGLRGGGWGGESWIPVEKGKGYIYSGWLYAAVKGTKTTPVAQVNFYDRNKSSGWPHLGSKKLEIVDCPANAWQRFERAFTPPADATDVNVSVKLVSKGETVEYLFDDLSVRDAKGNELAVNGSFEALDPASGEPVGWSIEFHKHNAFAADFGAAGRFLGTIYDLHGLGDLFVETGCWGYVPLMPALWRSEGSPLRSRFIPLKPWDESRVNRALARIESDGCEGMRAQYPGRLWLASSKENSSGSQKGFGPVGPYCVEAELRSSSQVLAVEHGDGRVHLLVSGRKETTTSVRVTGSRPFAVRHGARVLPARADGVRFSVRLAVDHRAEITQKLVLWDGPSAGTAERPR